MKFEYSDEVFEEIKRVMKNITGEDWDDIFGDFGEDDFSDEKSKLRILLDEYYDSHLETIGKKHTGPLYTPHLLEWLIKKECEK